MFFETSPKWDVLRIEALELCDEAFRANGCTPDRYALVIVEEMADGRLAGFSHLGRDNWYPCSCSKPFFLMAALESIARGEIVFDDELEHALRDMIRWSSNTATNYVIDVVTGTTGDTLLAGADYDAWAEKRYAVNRRLQAWNWDELDGVNISQKLMDDRRYGRERQFAGANGSNLNRVSPEACVRLIHGLFDKATLDQSLRARVLDWFRRDPESRDAHLPGYQLSAYLGGKLPAPAMIWGKSGHNRWTGDPNTSFYKHDVIRVEHGQRAVCFALFTRGEELALGKDHVFPDIGRGLFALCFR
ncbi:MAG: serine hydrolase [Pseudaminobacter sp.]|nr:serine hydrolase [Pseudaminobacter sp.]